MTAVIEAAGVRKRFAGTAALDGLDLVAEHGQVTAVLGPNGAGKTTFIRTVATLLRPDSGTLRVADHDVSSHPDRVRRLIGFAGQSAIVEPAMTGRENLEMIARLYGQTRREARANATELLDQLELIEAGHRPARTYSGGMRRRLDLGASLVGRPQLLLLDESTVGLDPRSRSELWDTIRVLVENGTDVPLTTRYLDEADHLANCVVIPDHGRVVATGTPDELKRRLGERVLEVHVRHRHDIPRLVRALQPFSDADAQVYAATRRVSIPVDGGSDRLMAALRTTEAAGLQIDDIALRTPNLDEVFLALTGQPVNASTSGGREPQMESQR